MCSGSDEKLDPKGANLIEESLSLMSFFVDSFWQRTKETLVMDPFLFNVSFSFTSPGSGSRTLS